MKSLVKVIISADDFGLCAAVNAGILDCCRAGAVSSVSVLAAGGAFDEGAAELLALPGIGIGAHLCLNDETPLSRPEDIPTLVNGAALAPYRETAARLLSGRLDAAEVYREWGSQIEALLRAGFRPDHIDSHNHVHLFPQLFPVALHLAEEYGIPALRVPGFSHWPEGAPGPAWAAKSILALPAGRRRAELLRRGLYCAGSVAGYFRSGGVTESRLRRWAGDAQAGDSMEIITHPGLGNSAALPRYAARDYDRGAERSALLKFAAGGGLAGAHIVLSRYADLVPEHQRAQPGLVSGVSVVIPARNEKENIRKTLAVTKRYLSANAADYEIIVVDDRSTDGTGEAAAALLAGVEGRVVRTSGAGGYGAALRAGFDAAKKERILYFDADYPARLENAEGLFRLARSFDIAAGVRSNSWEEGALRVLYRCGYRALLRLLFGLRASDANFAFKLFRTSDWRVMNVRAAGGFVDAELLLAARRRGLSVGELPMPLLKRTFGRTQLAGPANVAAMLAEIAGYIVSLPAARLLRRCRAAGPAALAHAAVRLLLCPVDELVRRLPDRGRILDFGCGIGVVSGLAALAVPERIICGCDADERKLSAARVLVPGAELSAVPGPGPYAAVLVSDVLYLLPPGEQLLALDRLCGVLAPGGELLLKETDVRPAWKSLVNLAEETLVVRLLGYTRGRGIFIRPAEDWAKLLEARGLRTSVIRLDRGYPHPHVLITGVKPSSASGAMA